MTELIESLVDAIERGDHAGAAEYISEHEAQFVEELGRLFGADDTYTKTKQFILDIVDHLPDRAAIEIIRLAIRDRNPRLHLKGLQALYRSRLDILNSEVAEILDLQDAEFESKKWVLHILASTDPQRHGRRIRRIARDKRVDVNLRREAIFALTNVADDESIGTLCAVLGDPDEEVRQAAAWSLAKISAPEATCCLLAALEDNASQVRDWAIRGLRDMDDTRALQGLANAIRTFEPEEQVRLIRLVAEKRSEIILRAITEALESPNIEVRREAVWSLGVTPYPPAAANLEKLLEDEDVQIRTYAQRALERIAQRNLWNLGNDEE
ncbi:MAG: HEAT repeat domain-containing protein [Candidatus Thorarchaeota archaeon]